MNKPLTVEELKALQPNDLIYIVMLKDAYRENDTPYGEYHKVVSTLNHYYFIVSDNRDLEYKLAYEDYGKTWETYKMELNRNDIINKAIDTYGIDAQCLMAIEEMSELTKAICKENRARGKENYTLVLANIGEEIADVRIMLDQLCIIFGIDTKELETYKLLRLKERLENN